MKKKALSLILVLALFAALAVPASASWRPTWEFGTTSYSNDYTPDMAPGDALIPVIKDWTLDMIAQYFYNTTKASVIQGLKDANVKHFMKTNGMLEAAIQWDDATQAWVNIATCHTVLNANWDNFVLPGVAGGVERVRDDYMPANRTLYTSKGITAKTDADAVLYIVKAGDTMSSIVKGYYRNLPTALVMPYIFQANKALGWMSNINSLTVGQMIYLPVIQVG